MRAVERLRSGHRHPSGLEVEENWTGAMVLRTGGQAAFQVQRVIGRIPCCGHFQESQLQDWRSNAGVNGSPRWFRAGFQQENADSQHNTVQRCGAVQPPQRHSLGQCVTRRTHKGACRWVGSGAPLFEPSSCCLALSRWLTPLSEPEIPALMTAETLRSSVFLIKVQVAQDGICCPRLPLA